MNIGIFTNNYLPNPYGVTGSIESFRKQFEKKGHQVFIFAPEWRGYEDENPNVFRYPSVDVKYKIRFPLAVPYSHRIDETVRNLDLDIIHSQHPNLLGVAAQKWARKKRIPLVFTWHTLYDQYTNYVPLLPGRIAAKWVIRNAVKYANKSDQIIVPTYSVKEIIENWGVTNENIEDIPTGIEEATYENPDGELIRKKHGIRDDEILLLLVSRLTSEKNVMFLLKSVSEVIRMNNKVKFLIGGDGYLVPELKKISEQKGVSRQVIFEGIIKKEVIKNYYDAADIFVYASKSETQGMIISEAMYSRLPVVAVRATGIKDLVEDKITGFLVSEKKEEFADAVNGLIDDDRLRAEFSENSGRIAREKYTSEITASKMLNIYEKLISRK